LAITSWRKERSRSLYNENRRGVSTRMPIFGTRRGKGRGKRRTRRNLERPKGQGKINPLFWAVFERAQRLKAQEKGRGRCQRLKNPREKGTISAIAFNVGCHRLFLGCLERKKKKNIQKKGGKGKGLTESPKDWEKHESCRNAAVAIDRYK